MPARRYSRHTFAAEFIDSDRKRFLSDRVRFPYQDLADNITHVAREGDHWWYLASQFYASLSQSISTAFSPAQLWWIVADYQLPPVHDPTIPPVPGVTVFAPSLRTVETRIFNPAVRLRLGL